MSSTSLRTCVGKRADREAIPILQGASVKTCESTYEVEYTIEKVCRFRISKWEDCFISISRLWRVVEAIRWLRSANKEALFERDF
jgi:hypothetical protein